MKKLILINILILMGLIAKSQDFQYYYDNNGNRTKRELIPFKKTQDTVVTDSTASITDSTAVANNNQVTQQQQYKTILGDQKITVYPNPTAGELKVDISDFAEGCKGSVLVSDMQGRVIYKSENINSSNIINLSATATGKYIMKLILDGKSNEWVIVKE